jgi:hypothetical protein
MYNSCDDKADFIIDLIERVGAIISDLNDGGDAEIDADALERVIELAQSLRDELELLIDE